MKMEFSNAVLVSATLVAMLGCNGSDSSTVASSDIGMQSASAGGLARVTFKLTDAPHENLKAVMVDVDHLEVLLEGQGKAGRLQLAQGLGVIDLLQLQNGVTLALQEVSIPAGVKIQQIRLILKSSGHYAVKANDSQCSLQTPSAQKTGVKVIIPGGIDLAAGHAYSVLVDFDALKSVVVKGNGDCLLKPVVKLASVKKLDVDVDDDGQEDVDDNGNSADDSDVVNEGEEVVETPVDNEAGDEGDGWDYTPIVDGVNYLPITDDGQVQF